VFYLQFAVLSSQTFVVELMYIIQVVAHATNDTQAGGKQAVWQSVSLATRQLSCRVVLPASQVSLTSTT